VTDIHPSLDDRRSIWAANVEASPNPSFGESSSDSGRTLEMQDRNGLHVAFRGESPIVPQNTPGRAFQLSAKRVFDIVGAGGGLLFILPLLLTLALLIKLTSRGPVMFRQERVGLGGKRFGVLKFRSMYAEHADMSGVRQTIANDPRVTPLGRFMRKTSLDELPQLLNVLAGEMSLVGPRPHVAAQLAGGVPYEELVPYYGMRNLMKPGLTGWAQANGYRGPTDDPVRARQRIEHDMAYIQNFSLWIDVIILVMTLKREFVRGTGH
jgi:lipopolysaccharide/colanic/teichoic acid biosynthesis glycosyltransferase